MKTGNKTTAVKILRGLRDIVPPTLKVGRELDVAKFNSLPEVQKAIKYLKAAGFPTSESLASKGFVAAALVLKY